MLIDNRTMRLTALVFLAACLAAQDVPDYFPLQVGNQWIYRVSGNELYTLSVDRTQEVNGQTWYVLRRDGGPERWLRFDGPGRLLELINNGEILAADFAAPAGGGGFYSDGKPHVTTRTGSYRGPMGTFEGTVLSIEIGTATSHEVHQYLPWVGRIGSSFSLRGGSASLVPPRREDLVYARVNGTNVFAAREFSFGLTTDRPVYELAFGKMDNCYYVGFPAAQATAENFLPCLQARVTLKNTGNDPVTIPLSTEYIWELELRASNGDVVYRAQSAEGPVRRRALVGNPGEVNLTKMVPLYSGEFPNIKPLSPGRYRLTARLLDDPSDPGYSASVTLELQ
jgi:hypothetical protein